MWPLMKGYRDVWVLESYVHSAANDMRPMQRGVLERRGSANDFGLLGFGVCKMSCSLVGMCLPIAVFHIPADA